MKRKLIIGIIILGVGQLLCFGQTDKMDNKLNPIQLQSIHDTHQYFIQSDGILVGVDTFTKKGFHIQNSYPKGGSYISSKGERFGYGVFWTRIVTVSYTHLTLPTKA